jgi:hypothetical protein
MNKEFESQYMNPVPGMIIHYVYAGRPGTMTVNKLEEPPLGRTRVFYTDQMEGGRTEEHSWDLKGSWKILLEKVVNVCSIYTPNREPDWEV